jgi:hypothetical protein
MDVRRYLKKISGPLLDRIDLHIEVTPVSFDQMTADRKAEKSVVVRERVIKAREMQSVRYIEMEDVHSNAMMPSHLVKKICIINEGGKNPAKNRHGKTGPFRQGIRSHTKSFPEQSLIWLARKRSKLSTLLKPFNTEAWTEKGGWGENSSRF